MSSGPPRQRTYLGAYGVRVDESDRLLLAHLATGRDAGGWTLPGGGVEWGEHPEDAVAREITEETGARGFVVGRIIAIYSRAYEQRFDRPSKAVQHVGILYEVDGVGPDVRAEVDGSTDGCRWFSRPDLDTIPLVPLAELAVDLVWPGDVRPDPRGRRSQVSPQLTSVPDAVSTPEVEVRRPHPRLT